MPNENPQRRTQADKERSRQQSRAVSGKEAAKGVAGKPGQGQRQTSAGRPQPGAKGPRPPGAGPGRGGARRPPPKGPSGRGGPAPRPRGSRAALFTWAAIGLVVIVVVVLVIVKITGPAQTQSGFNSVPLPAATTHEIATVPASVFNTVTAAPGTVATPHALTGQKPLLLTGKPGFLYLGGEFCPYCAAQRWAIATSLSRFGTFTGIRTMESSSTDVYPDTRTLTFATAKYTSPYIKAQLVEEFSRTHTTIHKPSAAQQKVITKFDTSKYTGGSSTTSGSIPFIDIGNKVVMSGSSYVPSILSPGTSPLSWADIAGGLSDPSNPVTQAIIATANYISAGVCAVDGAQPASVCKGRGVTEAAKAMGLKL